MYRGFYLNLARNAERRETLVRRLRAIGAEQRYERCEAIDGWAVAAQYATKLDPGNLGLWLTHEKVLQSLGSSTAAHLHIIEDDAQLPNNVVALLDRVLKQLEAQNATWDLIFTDAFVPPHTEFFQLFAEKVKLHAETKAHTLVDLARIPFFGTSSLIINKSSLAKYVSLLTGNWALGRPIDMYLRDLIQRGQLKALITVPYMTSISAHSDASDIRGPLDRSRRVCDIFRRAFFQDADLPALLAEMQSLTADAKISPLAMLFVNAEAFVLSDQWVKF